MALTNSDLYGGQMSIADNPISKPYLGGIIVILGGYASLPGDIRHLRLVPRYMLYK